MNHYTALLDLVTDFDFDRLDYTTLRGGNFHGGFVGLYRNQTLFSLNGITDFDQHFDDFNRVKVTNVWNLNCNKVAHILSLSQAY
jgi:hypothetical protein